jgi:hypothetical protein
MSIGKETLLPDIDRVTLGSEAVMIFVATATLGPINLLFPGLEGLPVLGQGR